MMKNKHKLKGGENIYRKLFELGRKKNLEKNEQMSKEAKRER